MTGPSRFQVDPDQIRTHAATVGDIAGQLGAVAGGQSGGLPDNALGSFVQFLTAGLQSAQHRTTQSISAASSGVDNVRAALVSTADRYQGTDQHSAARLTSVQLPSEDH